MSGTHRFQDIGRVAPESTVRWLGGGVEEEIGIKILALDE
jgi:hypothetical protein